MAALKPILPNYHHLIKYAWIVRCSCRITVLLLFLKVLLRIGSDFQVEPKQVQGWVHPAQTMGTPASAVQLSRAQLEAWDQGSTSLKAVAVIQSASGSGWNAHTKTHVKEVNLKSDLYCFPMFLFHTEKPYFMCLKFQKSKLMIQVLTEAWIYFEVEPRENN